MKVLLFFLLFIIRMQYNSLSVSAMSSQKLHLPSSVQNFQQFPIKIKQI